MRALLLPVIALALVACGRQSAPSAATPAIAPERTTVFTPAPGVSATIVAPANLDRNKHVDLILYALPNGNSTAETIGRRTSDSTAWRYEIQHIGAQTRALRARGLTQAIVVYLEAEGKSWPTWRRTRGYDSANARIVVMIDSIVGAIGRPTDLSITLTGHSGGGSLMFGFIEGQRAIPGWIERIAFLDANYNFDAAQHGEKLVTWLRSDPRHTLVSLAYDDREIMLDGKKVVSDSGGTWRATDRMLAFFRPDFPLTADTLGEFLRYRTQQIEILRHPNPKNRILHTEMIGEMNGYMHAVLTRRPGYERQATLLKTERAYTPWVVANPALDVEIMVARNMLSRHKHIAARSIAVDRGLALANAAPGGPGALRDSIRTLELAAALGARATSGRDSADFHLVLSEPVLYGDFADVTVTISWPETRGSRPMRGYETVAFGLKREGGTWRIIRQQQLGIT